MKREWKICDECSKPICDAEKYGDKELNGQNFCNWDCAIKFFQGRMNYAKKLKLSDEIYKKSDDYKTKLLKGVKDESGGKENHKG